MTARPTWLARALAIAVLAAGCSVDTETSDLVDALEPGDIALGLFYESNYEWNDQDSEVGFPCIGMFELRPKTFRCDVLNGVADAGGWDCFSFKGAGEVMGSWKIHGQEIHLRPWPGKKLAISLEGAVLKPVDSGYLLTAEGQQRWLVDEETAFANLSEVENR